MAAGTILKTSRVGRLFGWLISRERQLAALTLALVTWASPAQNVDEAKQSYFEFGTLVGLSARTVEVQAFDTRTQKMVQQSFLRTRDTHTDLLKVGDQIEIIFTAKGGEWTARRLFTLPAGIPSGGLPSGETPLAASTEGSVPGSVTRSKNKGALPPAPAVRVAKIPTAVALGTKSLPKVAAVTPVPLGISAGYSKPAPVPVTRTVTREQPGAACHQADPDWPKEPLRIAVLDFRYPTEREEAHDITRESGGSGMAVADLVYTRLSQLPQFIVDRGDHRRLDRSDIAGAARLGRELGADAVLEGTFFPLQDPPAADGTEGKVNGYELHAGMVDTCTGQVLLKLASMNCPVGVSVNSGVKGCTALSVTTKQAENPGSYSGAFDAAIGALLNPLEHNGGTVGQMGPAGVVVLNQNGTMTVRLANGIDVRPGQQLAVHATRLTKNPTTYTLEELHDQEIGRFTVRSLQGVMATGAFVGDIPALVGDGLESIAN